MTLEQVMQSWASIPESLIKPILEKEKDNWYVQLTEEWPEIHNDRYPKTSKLFNEHVKWMDDTRKQFKGSERVEYNKWKFGRKNNAEKLIMLYILTWDQ
jgi:hypothetical protein